MRKRSMLSFTIYFVCCLLFFASIPKNMLNCEITFKNIYWYIFYVVLYAFYSKKIPELKLFINRYKNKDFFLFRQLIQYGLDDFIFCTVTYLMNLLVLSVCSLHFSNFNLLQYSFHLFFLFLNYSFFNLLWKLLFLNKLEWFSLVIFIFFYIGDSLFLEIGNIKYFFITAGFAMVPEVPFTYSFILYICYLILWYIIYLLISLKRKEI